MISARQTLPVCVRLKKSLGELLDATWPTVECCGGKLDGLLYIIPKVC